MNCLCTNCKASFDLKDELLWKKLECPNCKNIFIAENNSNEVTPVAVQSQWGEDNSILKQGMFGKHKYGIKQKKIAINEKYYIKDENNNDLFFSIRRMYFWRRFLSWMLGAVLILWGIILWFSIAQNIDNQAFAILTFLFFFIVGFIGMVVIVSIAGRRWIEFYLSEEDANRENAEFTISQDNTYEFIHKHYTLRHNGAVIAQFDKNIFTDILRKKWHINFNGKHILVKEESVILGILRRLWIPFIRTNFIFLDITVSPQSDEIIGYFKRKFEIFDNYLLDMTNDPSFVIPREIAICMAVLLDCWERR